MDAATWLERRGSTAPEVLRERIREALEDAAAAGEPAPAALAEAALDRLRDVLEASPTRTAAVDLLAADALLTFACEAAADHGPDALASLVERYGPARFAHLVASDDDDGERPTGER